MAKKKSIFVKNLKTFKSSFTGEENEYKINNALWVYMERDFDITQMEWSKNYDNKQAYYGSIFATCLLNANGYETKLEEVVENTDVEDISALIMEYIQSLYEDMGGLEAIKGNKEDEKGSPS